ncbi:VTT domain-containing protein [Candidatus Woesearchaeota archaeon]|nr:VTT domain-containing protein [Candidatus Woesearchaeota archaeon]
MVKTSRILEEILKHKIILIIILILCVALYYNYSYQGITYKILRSDPEAVSNFVLSFKTLAPLVYLVLVILEVAIAPIPGFIFAFSGGIIFGTLLGGVLLFLGNFLGSIVGFKLAQRFGRGFVERLVKRESLDKFDSYTLRYGGWLILLIRLNPMTSSDLFNYAAGLSKVPFRHFVVASFFGLMPIAFVQTYLGEEFIKTSPTLYAIFLAISLFAVVFAVYGYYRARKK